MSMDACKGERISVIIPAFNEEENIEATLESLGSISQIVEIIVVDDASQDNTASLARKKGATVVSMPHNRGKGGAMEEGIKMAKEEVIAFLDADLGRSAGEVTKLLQPILLHQADMVIAAWPGKKKGEGGFGMVLGLAKWGIKALTGYVAVSPLSGQRVVRKKYLSSLESGFGVEVGMTVDCLRRGGEIKEIPVAMQHRRTRRDLKGFRHRGKQFVDVGRVLTKKFLERCTWK